MKKWSKAVALMFPFLSFFAASLLNTNALAEENVKCRSLDVRDFGLVSDGEISASWSEAQLIDKYGPPCYTIDIGSVYVEHERGRIVEREAKTLQQENIKSGATASKKQLIYSGDGTNKTSVFTILDGLVIKKERIY